MYKEDCIFCEISQKKARANIVFENEHFMAFENIKPHAPIHLLVIPKVHVEKKDSIESRVPEFWSNLMSVVGEIITQTGLSDSGYRLVNNGAGFHIIDHEHIHILGGQGWRPKDDL